MKRIKTIEKDTLFIVPTAKKMHLLEEFDYETNLKSIKFMSMDEVKKHLYFDYDKETLFRLQNKYDIKLDIVKVYLENMYYLNDCYYASDQLDQLTLKKRYLLDNHLLKLDPFFPYFLKRHDVVVYGYSPLTKLQQQMIEEMKKYTDVEVFYEELYPKQPLMVYEFQTLEEEVNYVANEIIQLLENAVDLHRIKLAGLTPEYRYPIEKIFGMYQIPINILEPIPLFGTKIVSSFLSFLELGVDFERALERVQLIYGGQEKNRELIRKLIQICNQYVWYLEDPKKIYDLLVDDFKTTRLPNKKYDPAIEVVTLQEGSISSDDYVFVLGMNHGSFPKQYKDEDFFSDCVKAELPLETTMEKNLLSKKQLLNTLYGIEHLTITYKKKTPFETYYPSNLIAQEGWKVEKKISEIGISYSRLYHQLELAKELDTYLKYGTMHENLPRYFAHYKDFPYLTYDQRFTGLKAKKVQDKLKEKLLLSYSSLDQFFRCGFRYYISHILKVEKFEESFQMRLGNIYHAVLASAFLASFDFEQRWSEETSKYTFTSQEQFFLTRLKTELVFVIRTIQNQHHLSGYNQLLLEHKVYLPLDLPFSVTFMGILDKVMYREEPDRTLIGIVDYKTGSLPTSLSNTIYGIGMQLPIYVYLAQHIKQFKNPQVTGFYLQKILHSESSISKSKTYEEQRSDALKLTGYTIDQEDLVEKFDSSYQNSEMIQSMKMTSKGFSSYAKLISEEEIEQLSHLVEEKIYEGAQAILKGKFDIHPKRVGLKNIGCEFCAFYDLCYRTEKDIVDLEEYKNLEFLGGDQ